MSELHTQREVRAAIQLLLDGVPRANWLQMGGGTASRIGFFSGAALGRVRQSVGKLACAVRAARLLWIGSGRAIEQSSTGAKQ